MRFRLNSSKDIAYRFGVSTATMSRIILKWVKVMDVRLRPLILWPERDVLWETMPASCLFSRFLWEKVAVILDCLYEGRVNTSCTPGERATRVYVCVTSITMKLLYTYKGQVSMQTLLHF